MLCPVGPDRAPLLFVTGASLERVTGGGGAGSRRCGGRPCRETDGPGVRGRGQRRAAGGDRAEEEQMNLSSENVSVVQMCLMVHEGCVRRTMNFK